MGEEAEDKLVPAWPMTLSQFADEVQNLTEAMLEESEDDGETHTWDYWVEQLNNAHLSA